MLLGHQKQWRFLKNSYEAGNLSHAYLFYGQEHLGKKKLALEFIKFLNCQSAFIKPCQTCRACQDIKKGIYPDFTLVEPEAPASVPTSRTTAGKREIKIAQMRKLEYYFSLCSSAACFKAAIINEAYSMTRDAQNSFLKTLEEPKGNTIFILITERPEALLPTILSRVQKIKFFPIQRAEILSYLKKQDVSDDKAREIINFCSGKPGLALNFLKEPQKLEDIKQKIKKFDQLSQSDLYVRFQYAQELSKQPQDIKEVLDIWLRYVRKALIEKTQITNYKFTPTPKFGVGARNTKHKLQNTNNYSLDKLRKILNSIQNIRFLISTTNVNSRLALETLMLEL